MEMSSQYRAKLHGELLDDEGQRNRKSWHYSFDLLAKYWIDGYPYSIWPESNLTVLRVIMGDVDYEELPYDQLNDFSKSIAWSDTYEFVSGHKGEEMRCEALSYNLCLREECPLFLVKGSGEDENRHCEDACKEYKIVFSRD